MRNLTANYFPNMEDALYHDGSHFGIHALMDFEISGPLYFYHSNIARDLDDTHTKAKTLGTATHEAVLRGMDHFNALLGKSIMPQPESYISEKKITLKEAQAQGWIDKKKVLIGELPAHHVQKEDGFIYVTEEAPWSGNAGPCSDWKAAQLAANKLVMLKSEIDEVGHMARAIRENPAIEPLLRCGLPETGIRWQEKTAGGEMLHLQAKPDWIVSDTPNPMDWQMGLDLKTSRNLRGFDRDCATMGYIRQVGWYEKAFSVLGVDIPYHLLPIENHFPNRSYLQDIDVADVVDAQDRNEDLLHQIGSCYDNYMSVMRNGGTPRELAKCWPRQLEFTRTYSWIGKRRAQ